MANTITDPRALSIIERLQQPTTLNKRVVEKAFEQHFHALNIPSLPIYWVPDFKTGYKRVLSAAWSAAWSAAVGAADRAARSAAESAAWSAAESAAWSAARSAAESAAESAAWSAAWSAARSAAWSAAESAAWSAAVGAADRAAWSAAESAAWSAAWSAGLHAIGSPVPEMEKLIAIWLPFVDAYSAGLWMFWVMATEVVVVERPSINIQANRLHCQTGPAVSWPSGEEYFFWHGVQVPKEWIMEPKAIDPKIALTWKNIEQRRAVAEIVGWARVLEHVKAKVIDKHNNPLIGTLLEADLPDSPKEKFLQVKCGTGRDFCLCVPRNMKTALQAQAWMWPTLTEQDILNMEART